MIFLTGDVHEMAEGAHDQRRLPRGWTEVKVCERYLELANSYLIRPTLFFSACAVENETSFIRSMLERYDFEIGGHDVSMNNHQIVRGLSRRILRLANGPYWLQKMDMAATIKCILSNLTVPITSWRNHAYRMDENTYRIAKELGITCVSNKVSGIDGQIREVDGIMEAPINTLPDHESLGHGVHSNQRIFNSAEGWVDQIAGQVEYHRAHEIHSVILAHPLCMFIEDRFQAFARLCRTIGGGSTATLRDCTRANRPQPALLHKNRNFNSPIQMPLSADEGASQT